MRLLKEPELDRNDNGTNLTDETKNDDDAFEAAKSENSKPFPAQLATRATSATSNVAAVGNRHREDYA